MLDALVAAQRAGHSLQQPFYVSPDIYRLDIERIFLRHWNYVGHVSQVAQPGDYLLFEIDAESVIVIRGQDGVVRALANVCRHRGSRLCDAESGHKSNLVCPYHAWVYKTDGQLRNAPLMSKEDAAAIGGLKEFAVREVEGLLFVSLADEPLDFDGAQSTLSSALTPFGWRSAKVVDRSKYTIRANWKLALENQVECYHCAPTHPEFSRVHGQGHSSTEDGASCSVERRVANGLPIPPSDHWLLNETGREEPSLCIHFPMYGTAQTASEDGGLVAPLMGDLTESDGKFTILHVGAHNHFLAYSDYGATFTYVPRSPTETDLIVTWMVRGDAESAIDYEIDRVTWLWRVTAAYDIEIVERNQAGVNSRFYEPGPYVTPIETKPVRLVDWYMKQLRPMA